MMLDITLGDRSRLDTLAPLSGDGEGDPVLAFVVDRNFADEPTLRNLDGKARGAILRGARAAGFTGDAGSVCVLPGVLDAAGAVILAGAGADVTRASVEAAGAQAMIAAPRAGEVWLAALGTTGHHLVAAGLGAKLGTYRFARYRTASGTEDAKARADMLADATPRTVRLLATDQESVRPAFEAEQALAEGVMLARDLVSEPPNVLTPAHFAERIAELETFGVAIEVLDEAAMSRLGFGALLGVAQGSFNAPCTVIMRYRGTQTLDAPLALIGKGVTFDSGGLSLKTASGMEDMKTDMAGAAAVVGTMRALAQAKAAVDVIGVVGLVENMVSGRAQRPGDVVRSHSGRTIEVLNTDAEGRLVLADLLSYTQQRFQPAAMIDLATLTGAIVVALGHHHAGLFANHDGLAGELLARGSETGEALWRMPLSDAYDRALNSPIADMKNIGGRAGGSITAAQFLQRFVGTTPWAHLDIAGVAWADTASGSTPKGASGFGVRLLAALVRHRAGVA